MGGLVCLSQNWCGVGFLLRLNIFNESCLPLNDKGINNKRKEFFSLLKNAKKHALNTLLTDTTMVRTVIKASIFLKVSNSIRNSISTLFCLDRNMPYGRE